MILKFAIASNRNFIDKTRDVVIPSLQASGIDMDKVHLFIGGYEYYSYENVGYHVHRLNHNSYEYSPLIEIVDRKMESDYWFLIHDTCKVGPRFNELVHQIPKSLPEKISIKRPPAMSIGSYRYDYLLTQKEKLSAIRNTDYSHESMMKWKLWGVPNEDYVLWQSDPKPVIYNNLDQWKIHSNENWYGTGTVRRVEYYPSLDLYKSKSNWGQTGKNMCISV